MVREPFSAVVAGGGGVLVVVVDSYEQMHKKGPETDICENG